MDRPQRAAQPEGERRMSVRTDAGDQEEDHRRVRLSEGRHRFAEVQVALLSHRISHLTEHLQSSTSTTTTAVAACCCSSASAVGC